MRKFLLVFGLLVGASLLLFWAYPTLLTALLAVGVVGGLGMYGLVRLVEWAQDTYGMDKWWASSAGPKTRSQRRSSS